MDSVIGVMYLGIKLWSDSILGDSGSVGGGGGGGGSITES